MKKKIVIKAKINCEKCKVKAMETVAKASPGVTSVEIKGDEVVVKGDEVDCAALASALRKKLGWADILSVEVEEEKEAPPPENKPEDKLTPASPADPTPPILFHPCHPNPHFIACECDCRNPDLCSIL